MKIELVAHWRKWWKLFSTWFSIAGASILTVATCLPEAAKQAWDYIPSDLKSGIPTEYFSKISLALWVLAFFSSLIRQKKLTAEVKRENDKN